MIKEILKRWLRNVPLVGNVVKLKYKAANKQTIDLCAVRLLQKNDGPIITLALNPNELIEAIDRANKYSPSIPNGMLTPGSHEVRPLTLISSLKNKKRITRSLMVITIYDPVKVYGRKYMVMSMDQFNRCSQRWETIKPNFANKSATLLETIALALKHWLKVEF